jgi:hypothetical protein
LLSRGKLRGHLQIEHVAFLFHRERTVDSTLVPELVFMSIH